MGQSSTIIANEFIRLSKEGGKPLTNMQLQKLVYLSQGFSLALTKKSLIGESVEAWQYGPVYRNLYVNLLHYGSGIVTDYIGSYVTTPIHNDFNEIIRGVWNAYGNLTGGQLSELTHRENTPWSKVYQKGRKELISNESMREHFKELVS